MCDGCHTSPRAPSTGPGNWGFAGTSFRNVLQLRPPAAAWALDLRAEDPQRERTSYSGVVAGTTRLGAGARSARGIVSPCLFRPVEKQDDAGHDSDCSPRDPATEHAEAEQCAEHAPGRDTDTVAVPFGC